MEGLLEISTRGEETTFCLVPDAWIQFQIKKTDLKLDFIFSDLNRNFFSRIESD